MQENPCAAVKATASSVASFFQLFLTSSCAIESLIGLESATGYDQVAVDQVARIAQGVVRARKLSVEQGRSAVRDAERLAQADLFRDVFLNPFRSTPSIDPAWLAWSDGTVRKLAEAAYRDGAHPGETLDTVRLAILADALEEAGCTNADMLGHCRHPGEHVRGCWALDLLLVKE